MLAINPIAEALQFAALRQQGKSVCEIAQCKCVSRHQVSRRLKLLDLEAEIQGLIAHGLLSADAQVVRALSFISDAAYRSEMARRFARERTSIKGIQIACRHAQKTSQSKKPQCHSNYVTDAIQTRVTRRAIPTCCSRNQVQLAIVRRALKDTCDQCAVRRQVITQVREPAWQRSMTAINKQETVLPSSRLDACAGCACVEFMTRLRREVGN